jgi:hypothetical protein
MPRVSLGNSTLAALPGDDARPYGTAGHEWDSWNRQRRSKLRCGKISP